MEAILKGIGPIDVLVAGIASAQSVILVTRDIREFSRIEGLSLENWSDA